MPIPRSPLCPRCLAVSAAAVCRASSRTPRRGRPWRDAFCSYRKALPRSGLVVSWAPLRLLLCLILSQPVAATKIVDDAGVPVDLPDPARRVVTLSPHATELAIAAGLGDRLVAISRGGTVPPRYEGLPRLGGAGPLDRERMLSLRPDLVIAWRSGNRARDLAWIDRIGVAVYRSEPASLEELADSIRRLARLGGDVATASRAATEFERQTRTPCAGLPSLPLFVTVWDRPAMTVGGRHWLNGVLEAAGFRNPFADQPRGVFVVAEEARLAAADVPQISLVRTFDGTPADRLADRLSVPGPGLGEAVQHLCRWRLTLASP